MTIQEAIKSGRPFARPGWDAYIVCPKDRDAALYWVDSGNGKFTPREEDLLADDWLLEPIKLRRFGWVGKAGEVRLITVAQRSMEGYVRAPWLDEPEDK